MKLKIKNHHSFFAFCLILLGSLLAINSLNGYVNMRISERKYVTEANSDIENRLNSVFFQVTNFPGGADQDVLFLSRLNETGEALENAKNGVESGTLAKTLERDYLAFAENKNVYLGFDLIGADGMALLSLDCNQGSCISLNNARDWSSNEIFKGSTSAPKGKINISDIHYIYHGSTTHNATIQYSTALRDNEGGFLGEIIATVNADYFLEDIRSSAHPGEWILLVNREGRYLSHQDSRKELPEAQLEHDIRKEFPDVAEAILSGDEDQRFVENDEYLFSYRRVYFTAENLVSYEPAASDQYWVLLNVISKKDAYPGLEHRKNNDFYGMLMFNSVIFVSMLLIAFVWYYEAKMNPRLMRRK